MIYKVIIINRVVFNQSMNIKKSLINIIIFYKLYIYVLFYNSIKYYNYNYFHFHYTFYLF
jgi:hypothetical protein